MVIQKQGFENSNDEDTDDIDDSSDSSDVSMSDSDEEVEEAIGNEDGEDEDDENETVLENEEEEEDEVIKAIRRENERQRDHPPTIQCEEFITDICFHPKEDIIAVASIIGDVVLYKYSNEENTLLNTLEMHTKACRDVEFNEDGKVMFSVAKDKSIMLTDVETTKLINFFDDAHDSPIYCVRVLDSNLFITGKT